jgi:hypothetical protein
MFSLYVNCFTQAYTQQVYHFTGDAILYHRQKNINIVITGPGTLIYINHLVNPEDCTFPVMDRDS